MGVSLCGRIAMSWPLHERRLQPYVPFGVSWTARRVRTRVDFRENSDGSPSALPATPEY